MEGNASPASASTSAIGNVEKGARVPAPNPRRKSSPLSRVGVIAIVLAVVLALALGLGLGLGLRSKGLSSHHPTSAAGNGASSDSQASQSVPPWRLNTEDYSLDISHWDLDAPPTSRVYNFTLAEIELAPDGKSSSPCTCSRCR